MAEENCGQCPEVARMREALQLCVHDIDKWADGEGGHVLQNALDAARAALSTSAPCPHAAEVERLRKRLDWIYKQCNDPARTVEQIGADLCRVIAGGEVEGVTYSNEDEAVDAARLRAAAEGREK